MIILDTNVLSELMRGQEAEPGVRAWALSVGEPLTTTVICRAELLAGIALLPPGTRRSRLAVAAITALDRVEACLPFSDESAAAYADAVAERTAAGRPIAAMDALVAAIARTYDAGLATRNARDFAGLGLRLINPWSETLDP